MFVAVFDRHGRGASALDSPVATLSAALEPDVPADSRGSWSGPGVLMVGTRMRTTAESQAETVPTICDRTGRVIMSWTRLDNRHDLTTRLRLPGDTTDARILLAAFDRWGRDLGDHLLGDFSFVIYDPTLGEAFAMRDQVGARPLFLLQSDAALVVTTTCVVLPRLQGVDLEVDPTWISAFVEGSAEAMSPPWFGVDAVAPGHNVLLDRDGMASVTRYFAFASETSTDEPVSRDWVDEYRSVLRSAVEDRLRPLGPIGVETSGGLDSSACLGFAADILGEERNRLRTFGFVGHADEADVIPLTGRMHGIEHEFIVASEPARFMDTAERYERVVRVAGYPIMRNDGYGHVRFFRECEKLGVRSLVSGFGGDEAGSHPASQLRSELAAARRIAALRAATPGWLLPQSLRIARDLWRYGRGQAPSTINQDVQRGVDSRHVANRLEASALMAAASGVECSWPCLDRRVVAQYLATPSTEKANSSYGRLLHRRAIAPVVPERVAWKHKSMGEPIHTLPSLATVEEASALLARLGSVHDAIDADAVLALARRATNEQATQADRFQWRGCGSRLRALDSWTSP